MMTVNGVEMVRGKALVDALHVINGERQDRHGAPEDSFKTIAEFWATYLSGRDGSEINEHDVAVMQTLMKIARIKSGVFHEDSYADGAGYLGLAADMKREQREMDEMQSHFESIVDNLQDHEGEYAGDCTDEEATECSGDLGEEGDAIDDSDRLPDFFEIIMKILEDENNKKTIKFRPFSNSAIYF